MVDIKLISVNRWMMLIGLMVILSGLVFIHVNKSGAEVQLINGEDTISLPSDGTGITGWSFLDKDSIHLGGMINYTVTIVFDSDLAMPDLGVFEKSIDVSPLEKVEIKESQYFIGGSISKYVVEYRLQAVNVALRTRYQLDPAIVYYTSSDVSELQSLEISSPFFQIIDYYSSSLLDVELKQPEGKIITFTETDRILLGIGGGTLILLVVITIVKFFRKVSLPALSEVEKLWLLYQEVKIKPGNIKTKISFLEKIFTGLIKLDLNIKPALFWSGIESNDFFWKKILAKARPVIRNSYKFNSPDDGDLNALNTILNESFSHVLTEEKKNTLRQPTLLRKLISQKALVVVCATGITFGATMIISSIVPELWVSDDVKSYNTLVDVVKLEQYNEDTAYHFSEVGKEFTINEYMAAAFYNAGTLMANNLQQISEDQALTVGDVFSNVAEDERILQDAEDILEILTSNIEIYRQSELLLRDAIRANPQKENIARNLEIVIKRRKAALKIINDLLNTGDIQQVQMDEALDLLESQMALEFEMDEGSEAPGYYIGEEF